MLALLAPAFLVAQSATLSEMAFINATETADRLMKSADLMESIGFGESFDEGFARPLELAHVTAHVALYFAGAACYAVPRFAGFFLMNDAAKIWREYIGYTMSGPGILPPASQRRIWARELRAIAEDIRKQGMTIARECVASP